MTRVDFYILADARPLGRERVACRLAEKAYQHDQKLYIHTDSGAQARSVDELLWTFRQHSFIPHACFTKGESEPVLIGGSDEPPADRAILINLGAEVPRFFSRFERVMEIVDGAPERRADGRRRFRFYHDRGYPLNTHEL